MGGGENKQYNLNLRKAFADTPDSRFEQYVDSKGDLSNAWNLINTYQQGGDMSGFSYHNEMSPADQARYWIKKAEGGRFNKADFGRFHAAEDKSLLEGNYPGGTEVRPGTDAYDSYFPEGKTRYEGGLLSGEGVSGDESGNGLLTNPGTGIGPYPFPNRYFPQLTHAYEAPQAQDWSQYLPSWINGPLSQMGGLLYQPGTQEYMEQFPMPENILNYQPPQINRQPVQYGGPPMGGLMEVAAHDPSSSGNSGNEPYDWASDPEGLKGGKMSTDVGYGTSSPTGDVDLGALSGLFSGYHAGALGTGWGSPDPTGPEAEVSDDNNPSTY